MISAAFTAFYIRLLDLFDAFPNPVSARRVATMHNVRFILGLQPAGIAANPQALAAGVRPITQSIRTGAHPDRATRAAVSAADLVLCATVFEMGNSCHQIDAFYAGTRAHRESVRQAPDTSAANDVMAANGIDVIPGREKIIQERADELARLRLFGPLPPAVRAVPSIDAAHPLCRRYVTLAIATTDWCETQSTNRRSGNTQQSMSSAALVTAWLASSFSERCGLAADAMGQLRLPADVYSRYAPQVQSATPVPPPARASRNRTTPATAPDDGGNSAHTARARSEAREQANRDRATAEASTAARVEARRRRAAGAARDAADRQSAREEQARRAEVAAAATVAAESARVAAAAARESQRIAGVEAAREETLRRAQGLWAAQQAAELIRARVERARLAHEEQTTALRREEIQREEELTRERARSEAASATRQEERRGDRRAQRGSALWHLRRSEAATGVNWSGYSMLCWPPRGATSGQWSWAMMPFILDIFDIPWPLSWHGVRELIDPRWRNWALAYRTYWGERGVPYPLDNEDFRSTYQVRSRSNL